MSEFDWDLGKARDNLLKHGVSFEEAEDVMSNPLAIEQLDAEHSANDERIKVIGWSPIARLVVVIVSVGGRKPRIISARRATKRERHAYEAGS